VKPSPQEAAKPVQPGSELAEYLLSKVKGKKCERFCTLAAIGKATGLSRPDYDKCRKTFPDPGDSGFPICTEDKIVEMANSQTSSWLNTRAMIDQVLGGTEKASAPPGGPSPVPGAGAPPPVTKDSGDRTPPTLRTPKIGASFTLKDKIAFTWDAATNVTYGLKVCPDAAMASDADNHSGTCAVVEIDAGRRVVKAKDLGPGAWYWAVKSEGAWVYGQSFVSGPYSSPRGFFISEK
jgi:hypothetical protein